MATDSRRKILAKVFQDFVYMCEFIFLKKSSKNPPLCQRGARRDF